MLGFNSYFRYLFKNKLYGAVTALRFAISMTFVLLLSIHSQEELAVDEFDVNKNGIYRMGTEAVDLSPPIAQDLKNNTPKFKNLRTE